MTSFLEKFIADREKEFDAFWIMQKPNPAKRNVQDFLHRAFTALAQEIGKEIENRIDKTDYTKGNWPEATESEKDGWNAALSEIRSLLQAETNSKKI